MAELEAQVITMKGERAQSALMVEEMNHRIKNTYALVQAVAAQTARHESTIGAFLATFGVRLMALARSTDELIRAGANDVPLRRLVEGTLAAHRGEAGRIGIEGAAVMLPAEMVAMVGLAFHELATNAVKHGSLSVPAGSVDLSWAVMPGGVEMVWREQGGPVVRPPEQRGFGSRLLEGGMPYGVVVRTEYRPEGLHCRLSLAVAGPRDGMSA